MNGIFTSELQKMRYGMDCEQGNQKSFSEKLYLSKMRRKEKRQEVIEKLGREAVRLMAALGLLFLMSLLVVPLVFNTRGYIAFGGEWMGMLVVTVVFWAWLRKRG